MIRAFFFASGTFTTLLGVALLFVDRVVLTDYAGKKLREAGHEVAKQGGDKAAAWKLIAAIPEDTAAPGREVIDPPDWAAFALLSAGGVTLLYSLCLPGRKKEPEGEGE
jgi:hypothetical protein